MVIGELFVSVDGGLWGGGGATSLLKNMPPPENSSGATIGRGESFNQPVINSVYKKYYELNFSFREN